MPSLEALLDDPAVEVVDIAVPPAEQPGVIERILAHPRKVRGILAQKPLALSLGEARALVEACAERASCSRSTRTCGMTTRCGRCKHLLDRGVLGDPVLATIEMRAIPHWMPWARDGRSLSTFIMSIHHLDTFRYWLGDPVRVLASTRPDPRTEFPHADGINLYILEYDSGARASGWDDVWSGPARKGPAAEIGIRWRFEGTEGLALGTIGWPGWPERVPSTLDYTTATTMGPGTARAGPKPGFPTPSPARWPGCFAPSRRAPSPTSRAATTSAPSPSARPSWRRRGSIAWCSSTNSGHNGTEPRVLMG